MTRYAILATVVMVIIYILYQTILNGWVIK